MKIRNGFVSNSSSSSFILKKIPESFTVEDVCYFYGMGEGYEKNPEDIKKFAEAILEISKDPDLQEDNFLTEGKDSLLRWHGHQFDKDYGYDIIDEIFSNPEDYFEFSIEDTYLSRPGCAYRGDYIVRNGLEISCH